MALALGRLPDLYATGPRSKAATATGTTRPRRACRPEQCLAAFMRALLPGRVGYYSQRLTAPPRTGSISGVSCRGGWWAADGTPGWPGRTMEMEPLSQRVTLAGTMEGFCGIRCRGWPKRGACLGASWSRRPTRRLACSRHAHAAHVWPRRWRSRAARRAGLCTSLGSVQKGRTAWDK